MTLHCTYNSEFQQIGLPVFVIVFVYFVLVMLI